MTDENVFIEGEDLKMVDTKRIAITVDILRVLNEAAQQNDYNQQVTDELFQDADERFPVYLKMYMTHKHKAGVECEEHMRTIWEVVLKDQSNVKGKQVNTATVKVDVPMDMFNVLPDTPIAYALATDFESMDMTEVTKDMIQKLEGMLESNTIEEE